MSLKEQQIASLKRMLHIIDSDENGISINGNFSALATPQSQTVPSWKILIYDSVARDIISPAMNVKDLREQGVTLQLALHSVRETVPDVPAVYFVEPTESNIRRIGKDFSMNLYGSYHFRFTSQINRERLEELAHAALDAGVVPQIGTVHDEFLDFISLERDLFCLRSTSDELSYADLHSKRTTDEANEIIVGRIVDGLFAVCVTAGVVPIIRAQRGHAAEVVAKKLEKRLSEAIRESAQNRSSSSSSSGPFSQSGHMLGRRPILVLFDRHFDLATVLHHTWSYQALIHDLFHYKLNRVTYGAQEVVGDVSKADQTHDLDANNDQFWAESRGAPFPQVAEKIQDELDDYRASESEIKKMKTEMNQQEFELDLEDNTHKLSSAITSLPALMAKKRIIDLHMDIASSVLEAIKARKLDLHFDIEEKIMAKGPRLAPSAPPDSAIAGTKVRSSDVLVQQLIELLRDPDAGNSRDKMRLFFIYYICVVAASECQTVSSTAGCDTHQQRRSASERQNGDLAEMVDILQTELECDMTAFAALKDHLAMAKMVMTTTTTSSSSSTVPSSAGSYSAFDYSGAGTKTIAMFSKLVSHGSSLVMEGVKNLVVRGHNLPITQAVHDLMQSKEGQLNATFTYLDPKVVKSGGITSDIPSSIRTKAPFQQAIVFVVGSGNYIEYQNLVDFAHRSSPPVPSDGDHPNRITYGCTSLVNATELIDQLTRLGSE